MKQRVLNPTNKDYHLYKDRHIDDRWLSFENFYEDMGERPEGLTLERVDNSKGYSKENCRWASKAEQAHNMCVTKLNEEKVLEIRKLIPLLPLYVIAKKYSVHRTVIGRIKRGVSWKEVANV
jgi:hypothetical protein